MPATCQAQLPATPAAANLTPLPCTALQARGLSSALSAASAVCDHVHDWLARTPRGGWVSMGVVSDGSYGITPGLVFSYPVTCSKGSWSIVKGGGAARPAVCVRRARGAWAHMQACCRWRCCVC